MSTRLPTVNVKNALGSTVKKIIEQSNSSQVVSGGDITVSQDTLGTQVFLNSSLKDFPTTLMIYRGSYSGTAHYDVNDVVRVMPDVNYTSSAGETLPATCGTWICVKGVPDENISDQLKTFGLTGDGYTEYLRTSTETYYPVWPEQASPYWELLSLLPMESTICVDGVNQTVYADSFQSGSTST